MKCPNCKSPIADTAKSCEWCDHIINRSDEYETKAASGLLKKYDTEAFNFYYPSDYFVNEISVPNCICITIEAYKESMVIICTKGTPLTPEENIAQRKGKRFCDPYNTTFNGIECIAVGEIDKWFFSEKKSIN